MRFISLVRSLRVTHEGNKSHDPERKAYIWLIFTLARILQRTQTNIDEKMNLLFNLFFLTE